ncbi:hypothetical protein HBE99_04350 [Mycobacteroides chelonae]|uniref:hypothetical protein n=1 Tax=Mycobacteroides chelonae TaxID=1774 RepID=UPI001910E4F1|nr:hypothetical protein [Mycobacteroides chelonae]QQG96180.1 hypothetical protein HBE99_04350 [Mycobacteroides chelonae]
MNIRSIGDIDQLFAAANDHLVEAVLEIKDLLNESTPEAVWAVFMAELSSRLENSDCNFETVAALHGAALILLARQS